jgi:hypothetical protein
MGEHSSGGDWVGRKRLGAGFYLFVLSTLFGCGVQSHDPRGTSEDGGSGGTGHGGSPEGSTGGRPAGGEGGSAEAGASGSAGEPGGAGGASGDRGDPGGEGPGGQPGCRPLELAWCDDGNDCTADTCTASGCQHAARKDGGPCDDDNACTTGDHCDAGRCTGEALATEAQAGGVLRSFASDALQVGNQSNSGLSLALSEELLVFTERGEKRGYGVGLELVLVRRVGAVLEPVGRIPTSFSRVDEIVVGFFPSHHGLHLVRLNDHRFALVGQGEGSLYSTDLEIYDADASGLALVGTRDFTFDAVGAVWDAEGHDDRLWLLSGDWMSAYQVAPDGAVSRLARFSTVASASAFAASEDHQLLYVGGQRGTFRVDVSDLANPIVDASPVIPEAKEQRPYQMTLQGELLFIQSEGLFTIGDARLYSGPHLDLIRRFPSTTAVDSPLGASFTKDGLLLQRLLYQDSKPSELRAELYSLGSAGATLSDSFSYADLGALELEETDTSLVPYSPTAQGALGVVGPSRRVVSTDRGRITELNGRLQGGFNSVRPAGSSSVVAFGRESAHRVALGPMGPSLVDGGLFPPATSTPQRLVFVEHDGSLVPSPFPLLIGPEDQRKSSRRLAWVDAALGRAPQPKGFFDLRDSVRSHAWQVATERLLFRLEPSPLDNSGTLRVYALPANPDSLEVVEALEPIQLPTEGDAYFSGFAVEPTARAFIIARSDLGDTQIKLARYERDGDSYELTTTFVLPCHEGLNGLLARGDKLALLYDNKQELALLRHDEAGFQQIATRHLETKSGGTIPFRTLLGIEGDRLYLSNGKEDDVEPGILSSVDAFRLTDLAQVARYGTPQEMTSFTVSGETLVFGGPSALMTASSACSP